MSLLINYFYILKINLIRIEKLIAGISLLLLLILALLQVILRNLFEVGFSEIDVVARHLVLFITFMGAALACEGGRHIKIDCVNSFLSPSVKEKLTLPLLLISSFICAIFFWYALQFWLDERLYAPANEQLALYMALIIPVGFFTLSLHLFLNSITLNAAENSR
jgi:TRAP-type transport system small permease protein